LEVCAASPTNSPGSRAATDPGTGAPVYLTQPPIVSTADVASVSQSSGNSGFPSLAVKLTPAGGLKMTAATTPASGQQVAIVANGKVIGVMNVRSPIGDAFVIEGGALQRDHEAIFRALTGE
jgi:preprotein translocase subunit SecD